MKTLEEQPRDATHWSTRSMAAATGMSQSAVSRIWRAFGLRPHQTEAFKLSPDPQLVDKVRDVVGLYMHPPRNAVVLPAGWYCTFSAAPATVSQLADGRVRLDYWDDRPEAVDVLLKARRRVGG